MDFKRKNEQLKSIIYKQLLPLIDNDYVLYDVPFHNNIGDLLIWEGELSFLKNIPHKMIDTCSIDTYTTKKLPTNTIILLHGGGNFGDIWRVHQEFRLKIIKTYPNNKIIILPQTVFYENEEQLLKDAQIINSHKYLTICARDTVSFQILAKHLNSKILLLPDMAFCIPSKRLNKQVQPVQDKTLYLKRKDKELNNLNSPIPFIHSNHIETHDWPSIEKIDIVQLGLRFFQKTPLKKLTIWYATHVYKRFLINKGIQFLSKYKDIYTTRLHVSILSTLLEKRHHIIDNTYGKNKNFYDTWLFDLDGNQLIPTINETNKSKK